MNRTTRSRTAVVTAALLATLALAGCAPASDATPGEAASTLSVTASPTPTERPYASTRSLGYNLYRVVDAAALTKKLGDPTGRSSIEPGAETAFRDGEVLGVVADDYGLTIILTHTDETTGAPAEPTADLSYFASIEGLLDEGLIEPF